MTPKNSEVDRDETVTPPRTGSGTFGAMMQAKTSGAQRFLVFARARETRNSSDEAATQR
jgi:hypothetical protein